MLEQLKWATQTLALEAETQLGLLSDFADKPFELIDDFDNFYRATRWRSALRLSSGSRLALEACWQLALALPEEEQTEQAIRASPNWAQLRRLARVVLTEFRWSLEQPAPSEASHALPGRAVIAEAVAAAALERFHAVVLARTGAHPTNEPRGSERSMAAVLSHRGAGLRLGWNARTHVLELAISQGPPAGPPRAWLDLYRAPIVGHSLPADRDVEFEDAIAHGLKLMGFE